MNKHRFVSGKLGAAAFILLALVAVALAAGFVLEEGNSSKAAGKAEARLSDARATLTQVGTQLAQMQNTLAEERAARSAEQTEHAGAISALEADIAKAEDALSVLHGAVRWQEVMFYNFPSTRMLFEMQIGMAYLLSEANGAPHTPDGSSPWERLQTFVGHMATSRYTDAYEFLSLDFHEKCSEAQFAAAASRKYRPDPLLFAAYLGTQIVTDGNAAVAYVGVTFGLGPKDWAIQMSKSAGGQWTVEWLPGFCS